MSHQHGVLHIDAHENLFHPLRNRNCSHFAAAPDLFTAQHLVPTLSLHPSNTPRPTHLHLHLHLLRHHPHLHPNLSGMPLRLAYQKGTRTTLMRHPEMPLHQFQHFPAQLDGSENTKKQLLILCVPGFLLNFLITNLHWRTNLINQKLYKEFLDTMYQCLEEPYMTRNGSQLFIKVDSSAIENLALCFAKSNMLDINLAKGTRGCFIEANRLLTVTLPTCCPRFNRMTAPGTCVTTKRIGPTFL